MFKLGDKADSKVCSIIGESVPFDRCCANKAYYEIIADYSESDSVRKDDNKDSLPVCFQYYRTVFVNSKLSSSALKFLVSYSILYVRD